MPQPGDDASPSTAPVASAQLPQTSAMVERSWAGLAAVAGAVTVVLIVTGVWASYWAPQRNDQYQLINLGRSVFHGGHLYVDCWENKPPGLAWLNALGYAISRGDPFAAWVLPGFMALMCLSAFAAAGKRVFGPLVGYVAVMLAAALYSMRLYDATSINPDFYSSILELAAVSLWLLALFASRRRGRWMYALAAGLIWSAGLACKQTAVVGLVAITLVTLVNGLARRSRPFWPIVTILSWCGLMAGVGGMAVALTVRETLGPAWDAVVTFNRDLVASVWSLPSSASLSRFWASLGPVQLVLWLALLGLCAMFRPGQVRTAADPTDGDRVLSPSLGVALSLWWLVQVALALTGPSGSMRYWQAAFPPMLILATIGTYAIEKTWRLLPRGQRAVFLLACATVAVLLGRPLLDHYRLGVAESYLAYSEQPRERDRLTAIGRAIQETVPAGDRIYVFDYDAGVYVFADRAPASRFTYPRSADQMAAILDDLERRRPAAILVPTIRSPEFDRWCDAACRNAVERILEEYHSGADVGSYRLFLRGSGTTAETHPVTD